MHELSTLVKHLEEQIKTRCASNEDQVFVLRELADRLGLSNHLRAKHVARIYDKPPLPTKAPEIYRDRADKAEKIAAFLERVYKPWIGKGLFQLLGHVIEMPMIQAKLAAQFPELNIAPAIPSDAEQSAFKKKVVIPAFFDAVHLVRIADVDTIREDLGEPQDFFRDVQIAKLEDADQFEQLVTEGATQWAELIDVNGKLLRLMRPVR